MEAYFDYDKVTGLSNALGGRVDLLEKVLGLKVRENLKYSDIQKIVKSGYAEEFFDLGDEIMTTYTVANGTVYDFPWRIVDFRNVTWEDGTEHPGMVLQSKYAAVEKMQYDAAEDDYPKGNALYSDSAIRQWLNSDAEKGEWWTEQHEGDVAPDQANTYNGFVHGLESNFVTIINPVAYGVCREYLVGTDAYTLYDRFYLPSAAEMYFISERKILEGPAFEYIKSSIGSARPSASVFSVRRAYALENHTLDRNVVLRSSSLSSDTVAANAPLVDYNMQLVGVTPRSAMYCTPCCVIS